MSLKNKDAASEQLENWNVDKSESQGVSKRAVARGSDGIPYKSLTSTLTVGPRGPTLLQDTDCIGILQNFVRSQRPPRANLAKGFGAYGHFKLTNPDIKKYSMACIFQGQGQGQSQDGAGAGADSASFDLKTKLLFRFASSGVERGPDNSRQFFSMSLKFYTRDGNYDVLAINTPVFIFRDPFTAFPFTNVSLENNGTGLLGDVNSTWDFYLQYPDTIHRLLLSFSDRGLPRAHRFSNFYPCNIFQWVNASGEVFYTRYHFKTNQGIRNLSEGEAAKLRKKDPDYMGRDLFNAISSGSGDGVGDGDSPLTWPSWTWSIQVMREEEVSKYEKRTGWNAFDVTKVWPQKDFPLIQVGTITADRNVDNHFQDVESAGFYPGNFIPGIGAPWQDIVLQGRIYTYHGAQMYRIGVNKSMLPCNFPRGLNSQSPLKTYYKGGRMNFDVEQGGAPAYYPNSFDGYKSDQKVGEVVIETKGKIIVAGKLNYHDMSDSRYDNFSQPRMFYENVLQEDEKERVAQNIKVSISTATQDVQRKVVEFMRQVSPQLATRIATLLQ